MCTDYEDRYVSIVSNDQRQSQITLHGLWRHLTVCVLRLLVIFWLLGEWIVKDRKKLCVFLAPKRNRLFHGRNLKNIHIYMGVLKCFLYLRFVTVYDFLKNKNLDILCLAEFLV